MMFRICRVSQNSKSTIKYQNLNEIYIYLFQKIVLQQNQQITICFLIVATKKICRQQRKNSLTRLKKKYTIQFNTFKSHINYLLLIFSTLYNYHSKIYVHIISQKYRRNINFSNKNVFKKFIIQQPPQPHNFFFAKLKKI
eukprot:TRINITY_DN2826_c0_g1_i4.p2 TRINITY_DN2826_c0_g1~~TRINITY_DN2826_c0_g1_i4.p2  ORF type:complete len:140 (+),score=1.36 TRINITY_DN2826_c0_g1_i4:52-471(+)